MALADFNIALRKPAVDNNGWGWPYSVQGIFENPPAESSFLVLSLLPAATENSEIGIGRSEIHSGILQIDLYTPQHTGDSEIMAKADEIRTAYYQAEPISHQQTKVRVVNIGISDISREDNLLRVSLDITYQSFLEIN